MLKDRIKSERLCYTINTERVGNIQEAIIIPVCKVGISERNKRFPRYKVAKVDYILSEDGFKLTIEHEQICLNRYADELYKSYQEALTALQEYRRFVRIRNIDNMKFVAETLLDGINYDDKSLRVVMKLLLSNRISF